ncbi:unnamed protein product [Blepharisma stoltei]|uniref:Uncharacterized protein n=1 Tax=Blepharisma stoltei TaxID=1481888 RepID=A0AAU9ICX1_9CILI|nr:unnamed protein product [Blepharisma stoltei]
MSELMPNLGCEVGCAKEEFFTPAKLSYDGNKVITSVNGEIKTFKIPKEKSELKMTNEISYREKETIYDYYWYSDTSKYFSIIKDHPILLHSAINNKILMKYTVQNHLCEVRAPLSLILEGDWGIYTALGNTVKYFDLETSLCYSFPLSVDELRISPKCIISAIGGKEDLIAIGNYSKTVYLFSKDSCKTIGILEGHQGGIIQCEFRDNYLYIGCRKQNSIAAWDLRNISYPVNILNFYRQHESNQRILFDLNENGLELAVGNGDGSIYKYSTVDGSLLNYFMGHFDAINSVQVFGNRIVTSSGQRHYEEVENPWGSLIRVWSYE